MVDRDQTGEQLVPGDTIGPWVVLERLDAGSFGSVFRCQRAGHPSAGDFALKLARNPKDPRFEREAELLQLSLPGQPRFEDQGLWTAPNGFRYPYVVMELVKGLTLYDWFGRGRTSREVLHVLAQVAGTLAVAHARGAVHRDVKGDNIRVEGSGRAVLVDWGSGWFSGARPLTDTTQPPGTTVYRPPEQRLFAERFRKDEAARWYSTPTDDLYSLGVTFYRCVTGGYLPPMSEGGELEVREVPRPSGFCTLSLELEALILRILRAEREQRGTAEQLAREALALATSAGEAADKPIDPIMSPELAAAVGGPSSDGADDELLSESESTGSSSADSKRRQRQQDPDMPSWLTAALAATAAALSVSLMLALVLLLARTSPGNDEPPWIATQEEVPRFAPDAGVADDALSTVQDADRRVGPWLLALGRPMPSKPHPDQRRPPCEPRMEVEINGGCWVGPIGNQKPPCGEKMFDYEGGCYLASFDGPKTPTSGEP